MSMTRHLHILAAASLVAITLLPGLSAPITHAQDWDTAIASLVVTEGEVTLAYTGADASPITEERQTTLAPGDIAPVAAGDMITVSDDGEALLTFFEGEETRLTAGTIMEVQRFEQAGASVQIEFAVLAGQTLSAVHNALDAASFYHVNTPGATISVRGTEFVVFVREDQLTQVAAIEGVVAVEAGDQSAEVPCGFGVKVAAGGPLGDVVVWGNAVLDITAPVADTNGIPLALTNQDNGMVFRYRSGDSMVSVSLGMYDMFVGTPGPLIVPDLDFPTDTETVTIETIAVELGAVEFELVDDAGNPVQGADDLIVTLAQGDLVGTATTAAPGTALLAGPGTWTATVALAAAPAQTLTLTAAVTAGELTTVPVTLSAFEG